MFAVVRFAFERARAHVGRAFVTAAGVAVAIAAAVLAAVSPGLAGDLALRRAVELLPVSERSVMLAAPLGEGPPNNLAAIDTDVRRELQRLAIPDVRAVTMFRARASADAKTYRLVGVGDLASAVQLHDGRLPHVCGPSRCEVLLMLRPDAPDAIRLRPELHIDIVGRARITDPRLLTGTFQPDDSEALLLADGTAVNDLASVSLEQRAQGWIAPLPTSALSGATLPQLRRGFAALAEAISGGQGNASVTVRAPDTELLAADRRSAAAAQRAKLPLAQAAALLAGFALVAALGLRRDHLAARDRLRQRGATRWQHGVFACCDVLAPLISGAVTGLVGGLAAAAWLARRLRLPARQALADSLSWSTLAWLALFVAVLAAGVLLVVGWGAAESDVPQRRQRVRWSDAVAVAATLMLVLALGRGVATPSRLAAAGDPLIAWLPFLASVLGASVAVRVASPIWRGLGSVVPKRFTLARVSLGELALPRRQTLATLGFLASATTLATFSFGYRSTLERSGRDQASFAIPLDAKLAIGRDLVLPRHVVPADGWASLVDGGFATDVVRRGASLRRVGTAGETVELLGVSPVTLPRLRGWRTDYGPPVAVLADVIAQTAEPPVVGVPIPKLATSLHMQVSGEILGVGLSVIVQRADGSWSSLVAVANDAGGGWVVDLGGPAADDRRRLIGFGVGESADNAWRTQHRIGEGDRGVDVFNPRFEITSVSADDGGVLAVDWSSMRSDTAEVVALNNAGIRIEARLQGSTATILPSDASAELLDAVVDPLTASTASGGVVTVGVAGGELRLRVGAVAERMPGVDSRFALVHGAALERALNVRLPGSGSALEVWIEAPDPAELRERLAPHTSSLDAVYRVEQQRLLDTDPLSRAAAWAFLMASIIAGLMAVVALLLAALGEADDQRGLHRALVAEGVAAAGIRRMVTMRGAAIAGVGLPLGLVGGLLLLRAVTSVLSVTAFSTTPLVPVIAVIPWVVIVSAVIGLLALGTVAAWIGAHRAARVADTDLFRDER